MHELEMVNGEAAMAYAGEVPWHGLGKKVPADLSPEQMLKTANLDWEVESRPLFYETANGNIMRTKKRAIVRATDDKLMTVVSDEWHPVQNLQAFKFFDDFVFPVVTTSYTSIGLNLLFTFSIFPLNVVGKLFHSDILFHFT